MTEKLTDKYDVVICVAGSRSFNDYKEFLYWTECYVEQFVSKRYCMVSGDAKSGADAMIIRWCRDNHIYCEKMPADWDKNGKSAGFIRNAQMRSAITHLLAFWDGVSSGTEEMIEGSLRAGIDTAVIIVTPDVAKQVPNKFFSRRKRYGKS